MTTRADERDLAVEQEVDFGRYWSSIAARWWLPLTGVVVGALVGYLIAVGGSDVYKASATLYLGTPYSVIGSVPLSNPQTNPATVNALVHSESFVKIAAHNANTTPSKIRGGISSKSISTSTGLTAAQRASANPLVRITVQAGTAHRASAAANSLADEVVQRLSRLADTKIAYLQRRIEEDKKKLETMERLSRGAGDATLKAVLSLQLGDVLQDQFNAEQLLAQAQQVERPSVLAHAVAVKTTARSTRNSVVVGAFLGLIIALVAALAWEPLAARIRR